VSPHWWVWYGFIYIWWSKERDDNSYSSYMYYNLTPSQLPTSVWMCVHILCVVVCMCVAAPATTRHSPLITLLLPIQQTSRSWSHLTTTSNRTFQYPTHRQNTPKHKERIITHNHTPTIHSKIIISVPCFKMCFTYNAIYSRHHPLHLPRSLRRRVWLVSASLIQPYPVTEKHFLF
jgi:hypothetical protein